MNIDPVQKYREAAARGWTQAETARQLGVTREAVRKMAAKHRIPFPPTYRERAAVRKRRANTLAGVMTREELAQTLGVQPNHVSSIAKGKTIRKQRPRPTVDKIEALAAQGMTVSEVARTLSMASANVSKAKAQYGIVFTKVGKRGRQPKGVSANG